MKTNVEYRKFNKKDIPYLTNITRRTWEYDKYLSKKSAELTSELDLLCYLKSQTFIEIAQVNKIPVGFIMARYTNDCETPNYDSRIKELKKRILMRMDGIIIFLFRHKLKNINKDLFAKVCNNNYNAELIFFAVDNSFRGLGIGSKLFNDFKKYFLKDETSEFYLYTDTTCNYKFYENLGLKKSACKCLKLPFSKASQEFYIYDNVK